MLTITLSDEEAKLLNRAFNTHFEHCSNNIELCKTGKESDQVRTRHLRVNPNDKYYYDDTWDKAIKGHEKEGKALVALKDKLFRHLDIVNFG